MTTSDEGSVTVEIDQVVFDADGNKLGTIRGFDLDGFHVSTASTVTAPAPGASRAVGEAELVWRCASCGELGEIDALPNSCPGCGAGREEIYYWIED